jgi:DNA-binding transcriptional regulator YbjK
MQWDHQDMSETAIRRRLQLKAPRRKFTPTEEKILSGWVLYRDLTLQSSTTENFREFAYLYFRRTMSPSYVTKFMKRNRLSLKQVGKADAGELVQEKIDEAVRFLTTFDYLVQSNAISTSQIKCMDKTYLMTSPWHKYVKHIGPRGSTKSRKICPERGAGVLSIVCSFYFIFMLLML